MYKKERSFEGEWESKVLFKLKSYKILHKELLLFTIFGEVGKSWVCWNYIRRQCLIVLLYYIYNPTPYRCKYQKP